MSWRHSDQWVCWPILPLIAIETAIRYNGAKNSEEAAEQTLDYHMKEMSRTKEQLHITLIEMIKTGQNIEEMSQDYSKFQADLENHKRRAQRFVDLHSRLQDTMLEFKRLNEKSDDLNDDTNYSHVWEERDAQRFGGQLCELAEDYLTALQKFYETHQSNSKANEDLDALQEILSTICIIIEWNVFKTFSSHDYKSLHPCVTLLSSRHSLPESPSAPSPCLHPTLAHQTSSHSWTHWTWLLDQPAWLIPKFHGPDPEPGSWTQHGDQKRLLGSH